MFKNFNKSVKSLILNLDGITRFNISSSKKLLINNNNTVKSFSSSNQKQVIAKINKSTNKQLNKNLMNLTKFNFLNKKIGNLNGRELNSYKSLTFFQFEKRFFSNMENPNKKGNMNPNSNNMDPLKKDIQKAQDEYDSDNEDQTSFYNQRRRMIYIFTSSCFIFIGMYLFLNYVKPEEAVPLQKRLGQVTYVGSAKIGGPWRLYNTKGEIVTHKDFTGKYYLIYFGFTQCPDVCPMSLQKIAKTLTKIRQSKEYKYFDLECIFVSVDPDRDSYDRIKNYCELFNKAIIGLTGKSNDDLELKQMLKEFKIHSSKIYLSKEDEEIDRKQLERNVPEIVNAMSKVQPKSNLKYSLDHTIVTYLMGPNNNFITYLSANLNHEEMYNIVLEGIMNDLSQKIKGIPVEKSKKL